MALEGMVGRGSVEPHGSRVACVQIFSLSWF